jgi:glutamate-1-semialdehyde 2,1-aminomutase
VKAYAAFFHAMLARGVYLPPAQFEVGFMSLSHGPEEIASVAAAAEGAFACLRDGGQ